MQNLKRISFVILLGLMPFFNASAQEIGKYIEQYGGRAGAREFKVKLLRIGEKSNEEVLIQISGVDDPLDGKIYKYKKEWQTSDKRKNQYIYVTKQVPGKERFATLHSENQYGSQVFKVYLYDDPMQAIYISPLEYQSDLDPNFMYQQYLQQQEARAKN